MASRSVTEGALTDAQVRAWIRAAEPIARSDGGGLTFTLSQAGTASWVLRYSLNGSRAELTLGNYPDLTLAEARKLARERRVEIDQGKDPAAEKQRKKTEARTAHDLESFIKDYRKKKLSTLSASTQRSYERNLKRLSAMYGKKSAKEITPADIVTLLQRHLKRGWVETETLFIAIKEVFKHASGNAAISLDPCGPINFRAVAGERPEVKKRLMLTDDELRIVMNANMNRQNQLSTRIILATCVRKSELDQSMKENIFIDDLTVKRLGAGRWHIPASKTGPAIDIPLAPAVIEWFRELIELSLDSAYLLPARSARRLEENGGDAPIAKDTIWGALMTWIEKSVPAPPVRRFTPHDLRSTAKSHLRALGVPPDISEMCLNHKLKGVEGIYDQYNYWKERRDALSKWAEHLVACQGVDIGARHAARRAFVNG